MSALDTLPRDQLAQALGGNMRLVTAFEEQAIAVDTVVRTTAETVEATQALDEATVVTLSPNAAFKNERVLTPDSGISLADYDGLLKVSVDASVARATGGGVTFNSEGAANLLLPKTGTVATIAGKEKFTNKLLSKPQVEAFGNYASDAAASVGGVPIGGVYRNGSALMVRVA